MGESAPLCMVTWCSACLEEQRDWKHVHMAPDTVQPLPCLLPIPVDQVVGNLRTLPPFIWIELRPRECRDESMRICLYFKLHQPV